MGGGAVMISELVDGSAWTMPPVDGCWATPRAPPPLLPRPEDEPMPMDAVPLESRETTGCEVGMEDMPPPCGVVPPAPRSEEHTSELQSQSNLVCRLLLEKKKKERY